MTSGSEGAADNVDVCEELGLLQLPEGVEGVGLAHLDERSAVLPDHEKGPSPHPSDASP